MTRGENLHLARTRGGREKTNEHRKKKGEKKSLLRMGKSEKKHLGEKTPTFKKEDSGLTKPTKRKMQKGGKRKATPSKIWENQLWERKTVVNKG